VLPGGPRRGEASRRRRRASARAAGGRSAGRGSSESRGRGRGGACSRSSRPTKATDPAEALAEKQAQAELLKQQFQPSAPQGKTLKIEFTDRSIAQVAQDRAVDMKVGFSPGPDVQAPLPPGDCGPGGPAGTSSRTGVALDITPTFLSTHTGSRPFRPPGWYKRANSLDRFDSGHVLGAEQALDTGGFDPVGVDAQGNPAFVNVGFSQKVLQQMVPNQVSLTASEPDPMLRCPVAGRPAAGSFTPPSTPPGAQPQASVLAIVARAAAAEARQRGLLP